MEIGLNFVHIKCYVMLTVYGTVFKVSNIEILKVNEVISKTSLLL